MGGTLDEVVVEASKEESSFFADATQFAQGFNNAVITNHTFGIGREYRDNKYHKYGQLAGDIFNIGVSTGEIIGGGGMVLGGGYVSVQSGGTLVWVGAPVSAKGLALVAEGSASLGTTLANAKNSYGRLYMSKKKGGSTKNSAHANERKRAVAKAKYEEAKVTLDEMKKKFRVKTPEVKAALKKQEKLVAHLKKQMDFTGENHSRNKKGN